MTTSTTNPWASTDHDPHHGGVTADIALPDRPDGADTSTSDLADADAENIHHDWEIEIDIYRGDLIAALNTALGALARASSAVTALASDLHDVEFAEDTAGSDVAAFVADGVRFIRAAYALTHTITAAQLTSTHITVEGERYDLQRILGTMGRLPRAARAVRQTPRHSCHEGRQALDHLPRRDRREEGDR
jgi:hypothetical protein